MQIDDICKQLLSNAALDGGFNAIGLSQGGLLLRGLVQRCAGLHVHNLVTFGSPHQGVGAVPGCTAQTDSNCRLVHSLVSIGVYVPWVQAVLVVAQYYKMYTNMHSYLKASLFLADINNERTPANSTYVSALAKLNTLVLVKFDRDTTVVPAESAWFGFFDANGTVVSRRNFPSHSGLGLDKMEDAGKVVFLGIDAAHMHISTADWELVARLYLSDVL